MGRMAAQFINFYIKTINCKGQEIQKTLKRQIMERKVLELIEEIHLEDEIKNETSLTGKIKKDIYNGSVTKVPMDN